jgi:hypothetical protein
VSGLLPGSLLGDGEAVGTIAREPPATGAQRRHLHGTLALIAGAGGPSRLGWDTLRIAFPGASAGPNDHNETMIAN